MVVEELYYSPETGKFSDDRVLMGWDSHQELFYIYDNSSVCYYNISGKLVKERSYGSTIPEPPLPRWYFGGIA